MSDPVPGYTHIHIILDRTGSMHSIKSDTIGGVNMFLAEQRKVPGKCTVSLVQFDSQDPYEVLMDFTPVADSRDLTDDNYQPRACTPLYDAIGRGLVDCLDKCNALGAHKPERVVFVIVTDGEENSSREWTKSSVSKKIGAMKDLGWAFVFLGVGLDAMRVGGDIGIDASTTMSGSRSSHGTRMSYMAMASNIAAYRTTAGRAPEFTAEQRQVQEDEGAVPMGIVDVDVMK